MVQEKSKYVKAIKTVEILCKNNEGLKNNNARSRKIN